MHTVKAIYDGANFTLKQHIPVQGAYNVEIMFLEPLDTNKKAAERSPFEYESMAGKMWIADDFDVPLDDFKEYME